MKILNFRPTYKTENGVTVIDESTVPIPKNFFIKERSVVIFPPGLDAGNHKHPRSEAFYSLGKLTLKYIDSDGVKNEQSMEPVDGEFKLFIIDPLVPHSVLNGTDRELFMVEFADAEQHDVEKVILI